MDVDFGEIARLERIARRLRVSKREKRSSRNHLWRKWRGAFTSYYQWQCA